MEGGKIGEQAPHAVSSGTNATGTISIRGWDPRCGRGWSSGVRGAGLLVSGDGTYPSSAVPVVLAGTYRWIASYTGDGNNNGFTTACNRSEERRVGKEGRSRWSPYH